MMLQLDLSLLWPPLESLPETTDRLSQFAEMSQSPGVTSIENVLGTVDRLDGVRVAGLGSAILADVHPMLG